MDAKPNWLDRAVGAVAPRMQLRRLRARIATAEVIRHYEGAGAGRRTQNWNRSAGDANTVNGNASLSRLREVARDLVRNNPWAESALTTLCDHTIGTGITARSLPANAQIDQKWKQWADSTDCDADGRHDFYGLEKLVMRTVVESGECLIRRRWRRLDDGYSLPVQLQVMEPDYLDTGRTMPLANGGQIVQGVEFDVLGNRVAYWLFPKHPGAIFQSFGTMFPASRPVPASEILHVFKTGRPGQVRGPSWYAPVILRMKELDEYEDATLVKQKIAACLSVMTMDVDGSGAALGEADDTDNPGTDTLSPGAVLNLPQGRSVEVVQPPSVTEYAPYTTMNLRAIATGLHVTYEDLTGDFSQVNFSSSRMARLKHWARVEDFRWRMMIPQFCIPARVWALEAMQIMSGIAKDRPGARWTAPPLPMIDSDKEGLAILRNARTGVQSMPEAIRERGYDPDEVLAEIAEFNKKLDALGVVLDSDPRKMTQAGQVQGTPLMTPTSSGQQSADLGWARRFGDLLSRLPEESALAVLRAVAEGNSEQQKAEE